MSVSDRACRSLIKHVGLRLRMSVSNEFPMGHVGLQWVSDEACQGLRSGMSVYNGSQIGLRKVFDRGFIVSDRSPIVIIFS